MGLKPPLRGETKFLGVVFLMARVTDINVSNGNFNTTSNDYGNC